MIGECADRTRATEGKNRIEWAWDNMPVLRDIASQWEKTQPLEGLRITACLHVTTETANLMRTLKMGGAEVALCASNPLSTQDDTAAALNEVYSIPTFAIRGADRDLYYKHIHASLEHKPQVTMDDGADLVNTLHTERKELVEHVIGGTEETTTGVIRLRAMEADAFLRYPIIAINEAYTKHMFDNQYGTGQSTLDGIMRATNFLISGQVFVVVGYGWCGRGLASRARGLGAQVVVVEVDPLRALEAVMDGFRVTDMDAAAAEGNIFVTVTGNRHTIDKHHFEKMQDGAVVANSGHFDVELNVEALHAMAESIHVPREGVEECVLADGRRIRLLTQGRLVNLSAAEGHPASVMDMSFANQALGIEWLFNNYKTLEPKVYAVPEDIDREIERRKLETMGVKLQKLTEAQIEYLNSYSLGT